jgi:ribulose 1,5-bisphosphate synthetase/thiazole synthase
MSTKENLRPIIIKKKKVISGGGHHGGAWTLISRRVSQARLELLKRLLTNAPGLRAEKRHRSGAPSLWQQKF